MKFKSLLTASLALVATFAAANVVVDYAKLQNKAERFFANEEWASANAMYILMLEQEPQRPATYAGAIVTDIMAGDTLQALDFVTSAMEYKVPFEDLLNDVRNVSFSIGNGDLYENFLLKIKARFPWLSRIADNYLMQYYAFRQNGPELINYAQTMLAGLPDNRNFMRMLATGRLLNGDTQGAIDEWLKIESLYPDDYATVLDLANCYDALGRKAEALKWMHRAQQLSPSPYIASRIIALQK